MSQIDQTNQPTSDVTVTPPSLSRWFQAFARRVTSLETSITLVQKNTLVPRQFYQRGFVRVSGKALAAGIAARPAASALPLTTPESRPDEALVQKPENHRGKLGGVTCFRISGGMALLLFGGLFLPVTRASEDTAERPSNSPPAAVTTDKNSETPMKPAAPNLPPEKYRDVDDAAKLLVWLVIACGLGGLLMLGVIVLGARRLRRLTRSQMLKSKYDELEFLRLKHRRETDGLTAPEPPKTEIR